MGVTGAGSLDMANQGLNYDLVATLTGSIGIAGCEPLDRQIGEAIPFTVRGTIDDPDIRPDFGRMIEEAVRQRVQEEVIARLFDRLGLPQPEDQDGQ